MNMAIYQVLHDIAVHFSSVQSLSHVWCFATQWTAARQASLSSTNAWSLLKLIFIESVMPSNHLILCHPFSSCPQSFPASGSFQMSQLFASRGQSIGVSTSTLVLPMNTQDWSPLGWTGWIPCSPRDSQEMRCKLYCLISHYIMNYLFINYLPFLTKASYCV